MGQDLQGPLKTIGDSLRNLVYLIYNKEELTENSCWKLCLTESFI